MNTLENFDWAHSFFELGPDFFEAKAPDPVAAPYLIDGNPEAAALIGLDPAEFERKEFVDYFSGNLPLPGTQPLAMDYSGHQFGMYNPRLGDGRGLLLGAAQKRIGTPLGHLPERLWTHTVCPRIRRPRHSARFHPGIPGRRGGAWAGHPDNASLAVIGIGELVYRETPQPGALLVRLSDTHVRFGSFENFHYTNRPEAVTQLADFVIQQHYPEIENEANKYQLLFRSVMHKTARLIANGRRWDSFTA